MFRWYPSASLLAPKKGLSNPHGNWSNATIENLLGSDQVYACISGEVARSLSVTCCSLTPFFLGFIVVRPNHFVAMRRDLHEDRIGYEWVDSLASSIETIDLLTATQRVESENMDNLIAIFRKCDDFEKLKKQIRQGRQAKK